MHLLLKVEPWVDMFFVPPAGFDPGSTGALLPLGIVEDPLHPLLVAGSAGGDPASGLRLRIEDGDSTGAAIAVQRADELENLRAAGGIFSPLELEALLPLLVKIDDGSLVESPGLVAETTLKNGLLIGLNVRIDAEVLAVDCHVGKSASWSRRAGLIEKRVAHELAHLGGILLVVVEGEGVQAFDLAFGVDEVQLDLERWTNAALGSNETFFSQPDFRELDAVDADAGLHIGIRPGDMPELTLSVQRLKEIAGLVANRIPAFGWHRDLDIQDLVGRKDGIQGQVSGGKPASQQQNHCPDNYSFSRVHQIYRSPK